VPIKADAQKININHLDFQRSADAFVAVQKITVLSPTNLRMFSQTRQLLEYAGCNAKSSLLITLRLAADAARPATESEAALAKQRG